MILQISLRDSNSKISIAPPALPVAKKRPSGLQVKTCASADTRVFAAMSSRLNKARLPSW